MEQRNRIVCLKGSGGRGILRQLDPRVGNSPERCAENLIECAQKIFQRLGLADGECWVKIDKGDLGPVGFSVESCFTDKDKPPEPPNVLIGRGESDRWYHPIARHPKMIQWLLWVRFRRLLKHGSIKYGHIRFVIKKGRIDVIHWTNSFRPKLDGNDALADKLAGAPANLLKYAQRTFQCLGLSDGECWVKLHDGRSGPVGLSGESCFSDKDKPPEPPKVRIGKGKNAKWYHPIAWCLKMIQWLLWVRFRRLFKHGSMKYGHIRFVIKKGRIDVIHWTNSFRPRLDGSDALADMFAGAPASKLWPRAKSMGP